MHEPLNTSELARKRVEDQHGFIVQLRVTDCVFKFALVRARNCNLVQQITKQRLKCLPIRPESRQASCAQKKARAFQGAGFAKGLVL